MAFPTFSVSAGPTVVLSRGNIYGQAREVPRPQQLVARSYAGTYQVATLRPADTEIPLSFVGLPQADHDAILTFLAHPLVNYAAFPFTYTDVVGAPHTVRYLASTIELPEISAGRYSWSMTLAVEPTP